MPRYSGTRVGIIYGLTDPRCKCVRYVGKSLSDPLRRHLRDARLNPVSTYKLHWLRALLAADLEPGLVIFDSGNWSNDEINERERCWIATYRGMTQHCKLTNQRDGGDGGWVPRYGTHSEETRVKLRAARALQPAPVVSEEGRARVAESNRTNRERAAKIAAFKREQWKDPEYRAKMTEAGRRGGSAGKGRRRDKKSSGGAGTSL